MASQEESEGQRSARSFAQRQAQMFAEGFSFSGYERDLLALNRGEQGFLDVSGVSGADSVGDGRGSVFADFDNDGDLDIFLRAMHGPAHLLFRNNVGQDAGFVRVVLSGRESGPDAFGAVVRLRTGERIQTKLLSGGSGFLSQSDPRLLFGLGEAQGADALEVTWPSGRHQSFGPVQAGETLLVVEGEDELRRLDVALGRLPDPWPADEPLWRALKVTRGEPLPETLSVRGADGPVALAGQLPPGRPVLINFWSTTCAPCRIEMPELERIHRAAGDTGLQILGVGLDDERLRERVPAMLADMGITYPVFGTDEAQREAFFTSDIIPIPLSLYLDGEHKARALFSGWSPETQRRLEQLSGE